MRLFLIFLFCMGLMILQSCGGGSYESGKQEQDEVLSEEQVAYWKETVAPIAAKSCALAGCHAAAGFVKSGQGWANSAAKKRILDGSMPVPGSQGAKNLSAAEKRILVNYPNN